jgi:hypothetical protein
MPAGRRLLSERPEGSMSISADVRKYVYLEEQVVRQNDVVLESPVSRIAIGAVFENPLAGQGAATDLAPLIAISEELGTLLTERALDRLGNAAALRAYGKAALVGTDGDLEHGAALIHPRLGMAMRTTLRRGKVLIPGNAKVAAAGSSIDLLYGPLDEGWDLDAMDTLTVSVQDAPRPTEVLLLIGYATGPRPNARSKGPRQAEVDALLASFG